MSHSDKNVLRLVLDAATTHHPNSAVALQITHTYLTCHGGMKGTNMSNSICYHIVAADAIIVGPRLSIHLNSSHKTCADGPD